MIINPEIFDTKLEDYLFWILGSFCLIKFIKSKIPLNAMVISTCLVLVFGIISVNAGTITEIDDTLLTQYLDEDIIPGTLLQDKQGLSYQVKGFPFFCKPLAHDLPNTYVSINKGKNAIKLSLVMLTNTKMPRLCQSRLVEKIIKLKTGPILINHNLE